MGFLESITDFGSAALSVRSSYRRRGSYIVLDEVGAGGRGVGELTDPGKPAKSFAEEAARHILRIRQNESTIYNDPDILRMRAQQQLARLFVTPAACIGYRIGRIRNEGLAITMQDAKATPNESLIKRAYDVLENPDPKGDLDRHQWLSLIVRDLLEVDGIALSRYQTADGVSRWKPLDPSTILPVVDRFGDLGRDGVDYRQVMPEGNSETFTRDELWFSKMNPISGRLLGYAPTEAAATIIVGAIWQTIRENANLEKSSPKLIGIQVNGPIKDADAFGSILNSIELQANQMSEYGPIRIVAMPEGATPHEFSAVVFDVDREESRRRDICQSYGTSPTALVRSANRATASEISDDEDWMHSDLVGWLEREEEEIIAESLGIPTGILKVTHAADQIIDELKHAQAQQAKVVSFLRRPSELRKEDGLEDWDAPDLDQAALGLAGGFGGFSASTPSASFGQTSDRPGDREPAEDLDQTKPSEAEPTSAEPTNQDVKVQEEAVLNGAQITAATSIVSQVASGLLPRDAGVGQLQVLFNLKLEQAEQIMGSAGRGFVPAEPTPREVAVKAEAAAMSRLQEILEEELRIRTAELKKRAAAQARKS